MKNKFLGALLAGAILLSAHHVRADVTNSPTAELKDLVQRIAVSVQKGERTEAEQADHIKEFDALLAKYKGQTNDEVAQILFMKAKLYVTIFKENDKGIELLQKLEMNFPDSEFARHADQAIADIRAIAEAKKVQAGMVVDAPFPDFDVKDMNGNPLSVAAFKGKVVLVDFWAAWSSASARDVPNLARAYQLYHDKGFEIIGVSLDREQDKDKLVSFTKDHDMPWPEYFDGGFWTNRLAERYSIDSLPSTILIDANGKIIAKDVPAMALSATVARVLGLKYVPGPDDSLEGTLVNNSIFPDFRGTDLSGQSLSLADYKGKVVLLDFWATWCPPCRAEAPNLASTYQKYHDKGFDIIGVSLDQPDAKDRLVAFTTENKMPWRQYFDGTDGPGKMAARYGAFGIPMEYLIGADGKILAQGIELRGEGLEPAVKKALGRN